MRRLFLILFLLLMVGVVSADTYIIYTDSSGTSDGGLGFASVGDSYAIHHNAATATENALADSNSYAAIRRATSDITFYWLIRGLFAINTSIIPDTDTINSVKVSLYIYSKDNQFGSPDYGITGFFPTNPAILATSDYNKVLGKAEYSSRISYADMPTAQYVNWTGNAAFIANVSKTGYTNFSLRDSYDIDNSFTGTGSSNYVSTFVRYLTNEWGSNQPFLTIVTSSGAPPDTTPPASITGLGNITTCQNITWQWTNPVDVDFNHTMVWKNNVFQYNLSNVTTSDLWESLVENTAYTFSSKTVDITGNVNITFVNLTSTTDTCPVPTTEPTTTATTAPPTTTTASPTPTPIPTPLVGCTYFNLTGVTFGENSTDWNVTEGLNTWGITTFNATQGNASWWICRATPTTTVPPIWQPLINPSTDIKTDWLKLLWSWLWLPILILATILLFRRQ